MGESIDNYPETSKIKRSYKNDVVFTLEKQILFSSWLQTFHFELVTVGTMGWDDISDGIIMSSKTVFQYITWFTSFYFKTKILFLLLLLPKKLNNDYIRCTV